MRARINDKEMKFRINIPWKMSIPWKTRIPWKTNIPMKLGKVTVPREMQNSIRTVLAALLATVFMICICAVSYRSIMTNASSGFKYYTSVTVESGETLWEIADEYIDYNYYKNKNSYITEVKSINHLDDNCSLMEGQVIVLPYYSSHYKN